MSDPDTRTAAAATGRGPCHRPFCGHAEAPDHVHGYDGARTYCGVCGPDGCPSYRAPSRVPCYRCGIPEDVHPGPPLAGTDYLPPDACPWWVRPPAWPLRVLTWILGR